MPYGSAPIFAATTASGIIFSFNAFQTIINMGSEIQNPEKNIYKGILTSLSLSAALYIILQSTFITSMPADMLSESGGWSGINFDSPFANLAIILGLNWLAIIFRSRCITIWYRCFIRSDYRSCITCNGEKRSYS